MAGIIVGVDGSEGGANALRWAVREAAVRGWGVTALMSWGWLDEPHRQEGGPLPFYDEEKARRDLAAAVAAAVPGATGIDEQVVCDLPARALVDRAADASLLVVGARGLGAFKRVLLGSVSAHTLHHSPCPVAIIRPTVDAMQGFGLPVVVGTDGSPGSQAALAWAVDEAAARDVELEALRAWQSTVLGDAPFAQPDPAALQAEAEAALDAELAPVRERLARPVHGRLVSQGAGRALVERSHDAGLVVVGSRGRGGFTGLLLGSVSQQLADHAVCPLIVVPHGNR